MLTVTESPSVVLLPNQAVVPLLPSKTDVRLEVGGLVTRLALTEEERTAAYRLRFLVFNPAVNAPVLFFPEGTTTDGAGVLPFRRGLFHSVLNNGVALRTAALRYTLEPHAVNGSATVGEDVCWWGEMGFVSHVFRLLGLRGLAVEMRFGDEVVVRDDRFVLSERAQVNVAVIYAELGYWESSELIYEIDFGETILG